MEVTHVGGSRTANALVSGQPNTFSEGNESVSCLLQLLDGVGENLVTGVQYYEYNYGIAVMESLNSRSGF